MQALKLFACKLKSRKHSRLLCPQVAPYQEKVAPGSSPQDFGLLCLNNGLLGSIVASDFGLLGFSGMQPQCRVCVL